MRSGCALLLKPSMVVVSDSLREIKASRLSFDSFIPLLPKNQSIFIQFSSLSSPWKPLTTKMASTAASEGPPPAVDFEVSPVQGQLGSTIMDLNGGVVRNSGLLSTSQASILYKMLLEVGMLHEEGAFQRMTVSFQSARYSVSRDANYIYIVQTQVS